MQNCRDKPVSEKGEPLWALPPPSTRPASPTATHTPPPPELGPGAGFLRSPAASAAASTAVAAMLKWLRGEVVTSRECGRAPVDPTLSKFALVDPLFLVRRATR